MESTDPIADMLTRIRNAISVGKHEVRVPHSNMKETVARQLMKNGYLDKVVIEKGSPRNQIIISINKPGTNAPITEISRMSKPGRRYYVGAREIPRVKNGRGIVLISTSKGVMSGFEAIKYKLGGELICKVY